MSLLEKENDNDRVLIDQEKGEVSVQGRKALTGRAKPSVGRKGSQVSSLLLGKLSAVGKKGGEAVPREGVSRGKLGKAPHWSQSTCSAGEQVGKRL